jgi:peroxiredoxin Q/BCP
MPMQPLAPGVTAPDFTLLDQHGRPQRLSKILETKAVVLYFYPKDETYGCTKQACFFRDSYEDFQALGAEVVGISADGVDSHKQFIAHHQLPFVLLSDPQRTVHHLYGVERSLFGMVGARITFVIDQHGIVRKQFDSLLNFSGHIAESLAVLQSLAAK